MRLIKKNKKCNLSFPFKEPKAFFIIYIWNWMLFEGKYYESTK